MLVHRFSSYLSFSSKFFHNQNALTTREGVRYENGIIQKH
jgi:hypothetical protein